MADITRANRLAQSKGFIRAEYLTDWNGWQVFEPIVADDDNIYNVGRIAILQNDKECRWTTPEEYDRYVVEVDESQIEDY